MPVLHSEKDFFPPALKPAVIFLFLTVSKPLVMLQMCSFHSSSNLAWKSFSWLSFSFAEGNWALPPEGLRDPVQPPKLGTQLASFFAVQSHILRNITDCYTPQIVNE